MPQSPDTTFKIQINFTKAYQDETGAYIEGIASGPEVDLTGERMAPSALQSMVESLTKGLIELRDEHKSGWNDDIGEIIELRLTEDNHLFYKAKLDLELSGAKDLWYRMTQKGKRYGVSIGGSIIKAGREYVAELGREIFTYFEVALHEISVVRQAAYQYSFANAVTKSLPTNEEPMKKSIKEELVEEARLEDAEQAETTETESTDTIDVAAEDLSDANDTTEETKVAETETAENAEEAAAEDADAETEDTGDEVETEAETNEELEKSAKAEGEDQVAKSVFANWASADAANVAIREITEHLSWIIWEDVYFSDHDDRSKEERKAHIAAALSDYTRIVQSVCDVLVDNNGADETAQKAIVVARAEDITKSIDAKAAEIETLTKSLSDKDAELETAKAALEDKASELETTTEELDTARTELAARTSEISSTTKALAEAQATLTKYEARKGMVVDKFGDSSPEVETTVDETTHQARRQFADFIVNGRKAA